MWSHAGKSHEDYQIIRTKDFPSAIRLGEKRHWGSVIFQLRDLKRNRRKASPGRKHLFQGVSTDSRPSLKESSTALKGPADRHRMPLEL
jgi:hypothetical protein